MKKVTFTFIVSDKLVNVIQNELLWDNYSNAVEILKAKCKDSSYNIDDYSNKPSKADVQTNKLDDKVEIICYNKKERMTRRAGLVKYRECMLGSEGSEHERYERIFFDLLEGKMVAADY